MVSTIAIIKKQNTKQNRGRVVAYTEILKLKSMLENANIPFEFDNLYDGYHLCYPRDNKSKDDTGRVCSVIQHFGSYGHSENLLEIMGLLTEEESQNDEVVGWLSAEEVFDRINNHYKGDVL